MKARTGNFIQGADEFDNRFFKISPREAKSMDPQQRVLLHTAYKALEDSGYVPGTTSSSQADTFGCYIGAATHDYVQNLRGDIDVYYSTGECSSCRRDSDRQSLCMPRYSLLIPEWSYILYNGLEWALYGGRHSMLLLPRSGLSRCSCFDEWRL